MYKAGAFTDNNTQTKTDLTMAEYPRRRAHRRHRATIRSQCYFLYEAGMSCPALCILEPGWMLNWTKSINEEECGLHAQKLHLDQVVRLIFHFSMLVLASPAASTWAKLASRPTGEGLLHGNQIRRFRSDRPASVGREYKVRGWKEPATMMQLQQLTSLITISWPLDYHINKDREIKWGVPAYYERQSVFPGHFVQAFVIWISSEALKAVILVHWCSHSPPSSLSPT